MRQVRFWLWVVIVGLAASGATAFPSRAETHPTLDNFWAALHAHNFVNDLTNGVIITAFAVAVGPLEGFLEALAIARFRFYGRRTVILVIVTVQMIPTVSLLIPLYPTLDHVHLTNSLTGIIHHLPAWCCPSLCGCCAASSWAYRGSWTRRRSSTGATSGRCFCGSSCR